MNKNLKIDQVNFEKQIDTLAKEQPVGVLRELVKQIGEGMIKNLKNEKDIHRLVKG